MCGVLFAAKKTRIYRHIYCIGKLMPEQFWTILISLPGRAKESTLGVESLLPYRAWLFRGGVKTDLTYITLRR